MITRLERLATLLLLFLTACTVFPPAQMPSRAETRRVVIPGEEADTLAETTGATEGTLVPLRTHDGREVWVAESALGGASLVPGTWVLVRQSGQVLTAAIARSMDDFVEVEIGGASAILPIGDVLARLHHGPPAPEVAPPPPPALTPPAPAPTPLEHIVLLESTPRLRAGMLADCSGSTAHVMFADGTDVRVPRADLHPLRVRAGDHVMALWSGSPYPAVILATRDSLVRARWEDESEQWIELTDVVSVEGAASGSVSGCPSRTVLVDEGARVRVGRILACEGTHATVLGSDGTPRTVEVASLVRVPLRVGDAVEALWGDTVYDGVVLSITDVLRIHWSDGTENDVDPADLVMFRSHEARPAEPASCPPAQIESRAPAASVQSAMSGQ